MSTPLSRSSKISFNNGLQMPMVGLGTFRARGDDCYNAVKHALQVGYRLIDTAAIYQNEPIVGRAMKDSGVPREEIFILSKLSPKDQGEGPAYAAVLKSLELLSVDYIDLYIIHWPGASGLKSEDSRNADLRCGSWKDLQRAYKEGKLRAIGLSNFTPLHLKASLAQQSMEIKPALNQVEFHPYFQQRELGRLCGEEGIVLQAYSSLGAGEPDLLHNPKIAAIAKKHSKSPGQVLLRWALQHNVPVLPKSINPRRIEENFNIFDFELTTTDMKEIDALDRGKKYCWDPVTVV